jgi:hypothetical protein
MAFLFAAYYVWELSVEHSLTSEATRIQGEADRLKPKAEVAKKREDELSLAVTLRDALVKRIEGRFYWAPVLDTIAQTSPREVQVTHFTGDVTNDRYKRANIDLEGICAGDEPLKVADVFRRALLDKFTPDFKHVTASFRSLEAGRDSAKLDGKTLQTAAFTINLKLQAGEDDPPPPPPKKKK